MLDMLISMSGLIGDQYLPVPKEIRSLAGIVRSLIRNIMTPEMEKIIDDCGQAIQDRPDEFSTEWRDYYATVISQMESIYCQNRANILMRGADSRKVSLERFERLYK
ncbi:MAG: hypothetical protein ACI9H8_000709 [Lysobacterales bacterium]|jgi:hypothetical protein